MLIGVGYGPLKPLLCVPLSRVYLMRKESDLSGLRFRMPA
jgi:hypothetical protein